MMICDDNCDDDCDDNCDFCPEKKKIFFAKRYRWPTEPRHSIWFTKFLTVFIRQWIWVRKGKRKSRRKRRKKERKERRRRRKLQNQMCHKMPHHRTAFYNVDFLTWISERIKAGRQDVSLTFNISPPSQDFRRRKWKNVINFSFLNVINFSFLIFLSFFFLS